MFITALFIIAKMWKQHKCLLIDEWIKNMWYKYTVEYYSAIKKNEIVPFAAKWRDLEIIIPSRVRQIPYHITYLWNLKYDTVQSIQSLIRVWLLVTPWTAAHQASLSITNSWSLLKLMCIESVMPSNHLILCCPLLLLLSVFPSNHFCVKNMTHMNLFMKQKQIYRHRK